jgi:signal transduction histidine kinase
VNRLLRQLLLTLVAVLIVTAALLQLTRQRVTGQVMDLASMDFIKSDEPAPPDDDAPWVRRRLPDNWRRTNPGQSGYGWYRARFSLPQAPVDAWAAYLPTVGTVHRLFVNGVDLGGGEMTGPYERSGDKPHFAVIPPHVLQAGANEVFVRLRVARNLRGGLGPLTLGPRATVQPLYDRAFLIRVVLPRGLNIALTFMGLLVLLLWLRRPAESIYGVFAALAIVWSLRNFHYTAAVPVPTHWWEAFILASLGMVVTLIWVFLRRYTGAPPRRAERVVLAVAALALPGFAYLPLRLLSVLRIPWYVACAAFAAWSIGLLLRHLRRSRPEDSGPWVILGAMVVALLLGLTDLAVSAQLLPYGPAARMAYGGPLLLCALVFALAESYFHTYDQARAQTAELERRVDERARELEATHERLRALERQATVAAERERLMRDMHDGIGSQLITTLEAVERGGTDGPQVAALLRECMDDLRLMIDSLEPDAFALQMALGNLRYRIEPRLHAAGITLQWDIEDGIALASPGAALHVLRIVQEAIGNALKHARAAHLALACRRERDELVVTIADDGCGIVAADGSVPASAQRGLRNMQLRARQLQGTLEVASGEGGTTLTLRVPLTAAAPPNTLISG